MTRLTEDRIARSPRWRPDGGAIAYFGSTAGFETHDGPVALKVVDASTRAVTTVLAEVDRPSSDDDASFPGLWLATMPAEPWHLDATRIVLTTLWRSTPAAVVIDVGTGRLTRLTNANANANAERVLAAVDGIVVTQVSSLVEAASLNVYDLAKVPSSSSEDTAVATLPLPGAGTASSTVHLFPAATPTPTRKKSFLGDLDFEVFKCAVGLPDGEGGPSLSIEATLLYDHAAREKKSSTEERLPLIVMVHGGPHSAFTVAYSAPLAFLARRGYAILAVNYRGSVGFGTAALNSLPGRIGEQDVADCVVATEAALARHAGLLDPERVAILGGSHGGFLAAHLVGQRPDLFKAAAMRNPVTNLAAMVAVTDIPDWCFVEVGGLGARLERPCPPAMLVALFNASPVRHIDAIKAPTLIAVGMTDLRVPARSQGMEFHEALKDRGVETRLLAFADDDHPLDKPRSDADHWLEVDAWFKAHLP